MKLPATAAAACLLLALWVGASADELGRDARKLCDSAWRMARGSRLRERQVDRLREACGELSTEELVSVVEELRSREDPPPSLHIVLGVLEGEAVERRWGAEAAEAVPDLMNLLRSEKEEDAISLLAKSLMLEDLRLARHVAGRCAEAEESALRVRAALALGDLANYDRTDGEAAGELISLLADLDAGVRAIACRRAFEARLDPVFSWAVEHLRDQPEVEVAVRGEKQSVRPGEEALRGLQAITGIEEELDYFDFRLLSAEEEKELARKYLDWWEMRGGTFPAPGFHEGGFRKEPSTEKELLIAPGDTTASVSLWAGLDRTRIRVALDELACNASTPHDFDVNFHLRYMAQGMRADDGEAYRRHFPVGESFVLARRNSGCYELVFQVLHGNRLKVRFRFYDPLR
jgi:hypothetical protein